MDRGQGISPNVYDFSGGGVLSRLLHLHPLPFDMWNVDGPLEYNSYSNDPDQ